MEPPLIELYLLIGLVGIAGAVQLSRRVMRFVPFRPKPNYGNCQRIETFTNVSEQEFGVELQRFFEVGRQNLKTNAPIILQRYWWQFVEGTENSAIYLMDYVEDTDRYVTAATKDSILHPPAGLQKFRITMNISWCYYAQRSRLEAHFTWDIHNQINHLSPQAVPTVNHTIAEIRDFIDPQQKQKSKRTAPSLAAQLSKKRAHTELESRFTKVPEHLKPKEHYWPTPQDFNEAIQNPAIAFQLSELKGCRPVLGPLGLPLPVTGAFASVYRAGTNGDKSIAIKCFLREVSDQARRYKMISDFVRHDDLDSTVGFEFIEQGILIRGRWYPILQMEWVDGYSIQDYVDVHRENRESMEQLCNEFLFMVQDLCRAGIAHGDLQHGNIIISRDGLRLVDYDGMFVPGMDGLLSNELGHRNYQHPMRDEKHFGPYLDNFSAWLIYLSLRSIAIDPELWKLPGCGDEHLLFRQTDFANPSTSEMFEVFRSHEKAEIRSNGKFLEELCLTAVELIPTVAQEFPALPVSGTDSALAHPASSSASVATGSADEADPDRPNDSSLPDWMK